MDHLSKALEQAKSDRPSVRSWVQPDKEPKSKGSLARTSSLKRIDLDLDHLREHRVVAALEMEASSMADRYRQLRTRLLHLMMPQGWRSVGITSPNVRAGKSLTALNLAFSIANQEDYQVVLIDADLRMPSVGEYLGFSADQHIVDFLREEATYEDIALRVNQFENLVIVPGGGLHEAGMSTDLLNSDRMRMLIRSCERQIGVKGILIVDMPPIFIGDDVLSLAGDLHSMIVVVDEGRTKSEELQEAAELLAGYNLLGSVLNNTTEKTNRAESYYSYR